MQETKNLRIVSRGEVTNFPLYVYWSDPQENVKIHAHEFVEIVLVFRGSAEHFCNNATTMIQENDVFVIPRGFYHAFRNASADFSLVNILFIPESLPIPLLDIPLLPGFNELFFCQIDKSEKSPFMHLDSTSFSLILELGARLHQEYKTRAPGHLFCQLSIFMEILVYLSRLFSEEEGAKRNVYQNISEAITYLNKHYKEPLNVVALCKAVGMSRPSLQRNFLKATGSSPVQYMLRLRIAEAVALLRSTGKSLTEISDAIGFFDCNYFGRQFKKVMGISPAAFRRNNG